MKRCIWCLGEFVHAPLEHTIQESLDGYAVTDKVCETCNKRIGHRLEERAQGFPLVVTARRRLGLIKVNPPPAPEVTIFKRLIAKIALEFLAECDYDLSLDPMFDRWREFVLDGEHEDDLLPRISLQDIYAAMPGYRPIIGPRNWKHSLFIEQFDGDVEVAVHLYGQILCKVRFGETHRQVQRDHAVMSIRDGASKLYRWNRREHWKDQKIVIPGKKRKRGRRNPEAWFR
jgi:hypothetical protein